MANLDLECIKLLLSATSLKTFYYILKARSTNSCTGGVWLPTPHTQIGGHASWGKGLQEVGRPAPLTIWVDRDDWGPGKPWERATGSWMASPAPDHSGGADWRSGGWGEGYQAVGQPALHLIGVRGQIGGWAGWGGAKGDWGGGQSLPW